MKQKLLLISVAVFLTFITYSSAYTGKNRRRQFLRLLHIENQLVCAENNTYYLILIF
jgi:hypothetical protein